MPFNVVVTLFETTGATLSRVERGLARPGPDLEDRILKITGLSRDDIATPRLERQRLVPRDGASPIETEVVQ